MYLVPENSLQYGTLNLPGTAALEGRLSNFLRRRREFGRVRGSELGRRVPALRCGLLFALPGRSLASSPSSFVPFLMPVLGVPPFWKGDRILFQTGFPSGTRSNGSGVLAQSRSSVAPPREELLFFRLRGQTIVYRPHLPHWPPLPADAGTGRIPTRPPANAGRCKGVVSHPDHTSLWISYIDANARLGEIFWQLNGWVEPGPDVSTHVARASLGTGLGGKRLDRPSFSLGLRLTSPLPDPANLSPRSIASTAASWRRHGEPRFRAPGPAVFRTNPPPLSKTRSSWGAPYPPYLPDFGDYFPARTSSRALPRRPMIGNPIDPLLPRGPPQRRSAPPLTIGLRPAFPPADPHALLHVEHPIVPNARPGPWGAL